mmetsp:Transcript_61694/g.198782  ORF Transcript_61694/g.198782 Transcript_61694/m.198782 type:complete len:223 (-) Transcript_61694:684-1352(-)
MAAVPKAATRLAAGLHSNCVGLTVPACITPITIPAGSARAGTASSSPRWSRGMVRANRCCGASIGHQTPNAAPLLATVFVRPSLERCQVMQPPPLPQDPKEGVDARAKSSAIVAKSAPRRSRSRHRGSPTESTTAKLVAKRSQRSPTARTSPPKRVSPSRGRAMSRARSLKWWRAESLAPSESQSRLVVAETPFGAKRNTSISDGGAESTKSMLQPKPLPSC